MNRYDHFTRLKGEQHRLRRVDLIMKCLRFIPIPLKFDVEEVLLTQLCTLALLIRVAVGWTRCDETLG